MLVPAVAGGLIALAVAVPLAWKWELGVRRVGIVITLIAATVAVASAPAELSDSVWRPSLRS